MQITYPFPPLPEDLSASFQFLPCLSFLSKEVELQSQGCASAEMRVAYNETYYLKIATALYLFCKPDQVFQVGILFHSSITLIFVLKLRTHAQHVPKYKKQCMYKDIHQSIIYNLKCPVIRELVVSKLR